MTYFSPPLTYNGSGDINERAYSQYRLSVRSQLLHRLRRPASLQYIFKARAKALSTDRHSSVALVFGVYVLRAFFTYSLLRIGIYLFFLRSALAYGRAACTLVFVSDLMVRYFYNPYHKIF